MSLDYNMIYFIGVSAVCKVCQMYFMLNLMHLRYVYIFFTYSMKSVSNTQVLSSVICHCYSSQASVCFNVFSVWKAEYGDTYFSVRMKENDLK